MSKSVAKQAQGATARGQLSGSIRGLLPQLLVVTLAACATDQEEALGRLDEAATVGDSVAGSCSTSVVLPLASQIADELNCMAPGTIAPFAAGRRITFNGVVHPYLTADPKADLNALAAAHPAPVTR